MVHKYGKYVIFITDKADFNCLHFAALFLQIPTLQWLVNEQGYSMLDKQGQFKRSGLDCLEPSFITPQIALLLAPLLCEKKEMEAEATQTDVQTLNGKFREIENNPSESLSGDQTLDLLIIRTVQNMVCGKLSYLPLLNELVQYKSITQQEPEAKPYKFLS